MRIIKYDDLKKLDSIRERIISARNKNGDNPILKDMEWMSQQLQDSYFLIEREALSPYFPTQNKVEVEIACLSTFLVEMEKIIPGGLPSYAETPLKERIEWLREVLKRIKDASNTKTVA